MACRAFSGADPAQASFRSARSDSKLFSRVSNSSSLSGFMCLKWKITAIIENWRYMYSVEFAAYTVIFLNVSFSNAFFSV